MIDQHTGGRPPSAASSEAWPGGQTAASRDLNRPLDASPLLRGIMADTRLVVAGGTLVGFVASVVVGRLLWSGR
jgi:hypothetical protein